MASAALVLFIGLSAGLGHAQSAGPKIVIARTEFDAGEVKEGVGVTHKFEFKNEGTAPLEIKNVVLTCGCETVDYDKVIAPGQAGHITLLVKTTGLNGAASKLIVVTTNDPQKPSIDLVMHLTVINDAKGPQGQVIGSFIVSPASQVAKSVPVGTAADFALTVYATSTPPARITKAVSESGKFNVTLEPAAGNRYVVRAVSPANLPVGRYQDSVKLITDSKETPQIELQLDATIVLPLRLSPKSIAFDRVAASEGEAPRASKFVWVMQSGGPAFEMKGVQSTLPFLTAERTENGNPGTIILRVFFTGIPPKGSHTGKVTINTNIPSQPQIDFDVTVNVP
jgi:hypothetical protein